MIRRFCLLLILVFAFSMETTLTLAAEMIIESDDQFDFALQTMEKKEYIRAVAEFERFVHFFPHDDKVPRARLLIGVCYLKAKNYESARKVLFSVHETYAETVIGGKALFWIGESYYRQNASAEAERYFTKVVENYPQLELKNAAVYRIGWSRMKSSRWQDASETFKAVERESPLFPTAQDLAVKSLDGEALPYKNPPTAGVMAALLPGLGHAYCERYKDALVAFLLNGLFIWATIESFDEDHDALGVILGFLEVGWYAGNIYSAVNVAHKHNRRIKNEYLRNLPDTLNLNLFTTGKGHFGLALRIDF